MKFPTNAWRGIFQDYLDAVGPSTEAPEEFHFSNFMVVAGFMLVRQAYIENPTAAYFNFAVMNIGETGRERKTTAQSLARKLLPDPIPATWITDLGGVASGEGILDALKDNDAATGHVGLMTVDELSALLRKSQQRGSTLTEFLIQLLDGTTPLRLAVRSNPVSCTDSLITISANATPGSLVDNVSEEIILGGLINRFLVFYAKATNIIPNPKAPDRVKLDHIRKRLWALSQTNHGAIHLSPHAEATWDTHYKSRMGRPSICDIERAVSARTELHIRRLAGLYAVLEGTGNVTDDQLQAAIAVGLYCESAGIDLMREISGTRDARMENRILGLIRVSGGSMKRRDLHQKLGGRVSGEKLIRLLRGLEDVGRVVRAGTDIKIYP